MCEWLGPQGDIVVDLSLEGSHWVTENSRGLFPDEKDSRLLGLCWGCQGEQWENNYLSHAWKHSGKRLPGPTALV